MPNRTDRAFRQEGTIETKSLYGNGDGIAGNAVLEQNDRDPCAWLDCRGDLHVDLIESHKTGCQTGKDYIRRQASYLRFYGNFHACERLLRRRQLPGGDRGLGRSQASTEDGDERTAARRLGSTSGDAPLWGRKNV